MRLVSRVKVTGDEDARSYPRSVTPIPRFSSPSSFSITLGEAKSNPGLPPALTLNGESWPNITPIRVPLGTTWEYDVLNETSAPHPFHLHGFFFQILSRDGVVEPEGHRLSEGIG